MTIARGGGKSHCTAVATDGEAVVAFVPDLIENA